MGASFKKFISVLCVLSLLIGLVPSAAFAAPAGTAAEAVSGTMKTESGEPAADRSVGFSPKTSEVGSGPSTWSELVTAIMQTGPGGTITLAGDITADSSSNALVFGSVENVTLDLNNHTIDRNASEASSLGYVIEVESGSVTIKNGTITGGKSNENGGGIYMTGGELTLSNVTVTGNRSGNGGGIRVKSGTLTMQNSNVTNNTAKYGGGIYVDYAGTLNMSGGSIANNTTSGSGSGSGGGIYANNGTVNLSDGSIANNSSSDNGGGIYMESGKIVMSGGSITGNTSTFWGGGIYLNGSKMELSGGTISNNTANNEKFKGVYLGSNHPLTLSKNSTITVDRIYLPPGKTLTVSEAPAADSKIRVMLETIPSMGNPVVIADSETNCSSSFVVDNNNLPENTELAWKNNQIILRCFSTVITSWEEIQDALDRGGNLQSDNTYMLQLTQDLTAESSDNTLVFAYTQHPVILDLNGHTINRNLTAATENGNVLTVNGGNLIVRDSSAAKTGSITGGNSSAAGGGVVVNGGSFTLESGRITGNTTGNAGGGVVVNGGSAIILGGSITGNTANNNWGAGVYLSRSGSLTLSGSSVPIVTDSVFLPSGKTMTLTGSPAVGSSIPVSVQSPPTFGSPVTIAVSELDEQGWKNCFTVVGQTTEQLIWAEKKLIYQVKPEVSDWEGLEYALSIGGAVEYTEEGSVRLIRLANDITAASNHNVLSFDYTDAPVILDLNGHKIDRNLETYDQYGHVLNVYGGELILRDNVGGGQITGGFGHVCGGIYVYEGILTMEGGSITGNKGTVYGGVYVNNGAEMNLKGGSISGNTADRSDNPEKYAGGYVDAHAAFKLYGNSAITVTDSLYLPENSKIQVVSAPAAGSQVYVSLHRDPTIGNPVVFAQSTADYSSVFHMANQPANTEIVYDGGFIKLVTEGVKSWTALQAALNSGGVQVGDEYWIELGADIVATSENSRLVMENVAHTVILDLNGHSINRALTQAAENGNVLTVNGGNLTIRDSQGGGSIKGGNNSAAGGGVVVNGGSFTLESGTITGNSTDSNGGGVYVTGNDGYFTIESGSITGNTSAAKGGGVYNEGSQLYLKGGSITGNTSTDLGGGIYMSNARLQSSGSPVVTGNGNSNVYLTEPMDNNGLTQDASIGVGASFTSVFVESNVDGIFAADEGYILFEKTHGYLQIEPDSHEAESEPRWTWSDDLTTATATMYCKNCGKMIWTASDTEVTFEYDTTAKKLYAIASVEHDNENYLGRLELHPLRVEEQQPRIDEDKVYHSGTKAHYKLNVVNATYYFTEVDEHPGLQCTEESVRLDTFTFAEKDGVRGIAAYTGGFSETGTTYIRLPGAIENPAHPGDPVHAFELSFLGDGTHAFYTPTSANGPVEIMDYGTITNIRAGAFAAIQNLTLKLRAYDEPDEPITIEDGAFVNGADVTIIAYSTSRLVKGEHQQGTGESAGKYTVEFVDEPSYTMTADWAEDYSSAQITITDEAITHTFPATNITRTETQTQQGTYTISFTASGTYEGTLYTVALDNVPYFNVTVQGTSGTLRMPKVRNADNTDYTDYAVFTVKQDMLDRLSPPAGAVLAGLYDGMRIYGVGTRVEIRQDTNFTAGWRSTWARVQTALSAGGTVSVTLYSDISPAQGDSYLYVPQGVTATLNLGGHTVNRGLSTATANGYVIRVDGSLTLNNGTVTGGNNTGDGGGIYLFDGGSLITNNVTVSSNHAQNGGGVYMVDVSQAEFNNNSTISYNVANQYGGGLYVGGERPSSNSVFLGDPSGSTNAKLVDVSIIHNRAQNAGGLFVNSGEVQLGSNTKIINNTDLSGGKFNNIDVVGGIMNLISGAKGLLLGLPAAAGGVSSLKGWALGLLGALAVGGTIAAVVVLDRDKTSSDDDQEEECQTHSLVSDLKWAKDYSSVKEYVRCSECGKIFEINDLPLSVTIDNDMYTHYKVKPKYPTTDDTDQKVPPYKLVKQANIPAAIDTTDTAGDFIDDVKLIPHGKGQPWEEVLESPRWQFVENGDKLEFDDWLWNNSKVTKVNFTGPDDQTITVQVHWLLPYGYAPHDSVPYDSVEDRVVGNHPLTPDTNPKYVESGAQETVKENNWTRKLYKFTAWRVPASVKIVKEDARYKLVYTYSEVDVKEIEDKKKPGDQLRITGPVILRAEWQSKWKDLDETLNKTASFPMTEPIFATLIDQTIKIKEGHTGALVLDGMMLNGAAAPGVQSVLNVLGTLTIMDTTPTGMIMGGHTVSNGGGITVGSNGTLILQGGNIVSNAAQMLNGNDGNGGGVSVSGNFIMSGGSVQNNTAGGNGGGVRIANNAVFSMSGGEISGNRAGINDQNAKGGGVYVGGSFSVSGMVIIKDNTVGFDASNVYLPTGKTIMVSGKLDDAAEIHVSMQTPGVITSGLNAKGGNQAKGKAANFVSDDPNYNVVINAAGEAALVSKDASPYFSEARLELGGILRMRFYMDYPEGWDRTGDYMEFRMAYMDPLTPEAKTDEQGEIYYACPVNAYRMADTITAVYYHDGEAISSKDYTIKQYLETMINWEYSNDDKAIAMATANYGHYIQPYLAQTNGWEYGVKYKTMDLYYPERRSSEETVDSGDYPLTFSKEDAYSQYVDKVAFYLTLDSDTLLNVRIYLKNPGDTVTGSVGDKELPQWNRANNSVVVCLEGINAKALDDTYTFECKVNGVPVFTLSASALTFVKRVFPTSTDTVEKDALHALYDYAQAAEAYAPSS